MILSMSKIYIVDMYSKLLRLWEWFLKSCIVVVNYMQYTYVCLYIYMNKLIDKIKVTHHITDKLVAHHIRDNLVPVAVDIVSPSIVGVISWLSVVKARPGVR